MPIVLGADFLLGRPDAIHGDDDHVRVFLAVSVGFGSAIRSRISPTRM